MKILLSQLIQGIAGSEKYLLEIFPQLQKHGIEIEFLCLYFHKQKNNTTEFCKRLNKLNVPIHMVGVTKIPNHNSLIAVNKIIKEGKFDIIHSHLLHADLLLSLSKFIFNTSYKLVSTKHGYEESYNNSHGFDPNFKKRNKYWIAARFAETQMNRSFAVSDGLKQLYTGLGICKPDKLDVIKHGFDYDDNYEKNTSYRFGNPQLSMVGRLTEFKGHRYAFQVIKNLKERYPNIFLVVVGFGESENEIKALAKEMEIKDHIEFTGFKPNPRDYIFASDIALLPSVSEGFGLVVLEAMSVKRPIVAFDVPSPNELIEHKKTGWLVPPFNTDLFTEAVTYLIEHPDKSNEIGNNAYNKLKEYYTLERMVSETISFYQTVKHSV